MNNKEDIFLTDEEKERYERQLLIKEIQEKGQKKIKQASAFLIGAGGLGSVISYYLVAAGIGRLGIIDSDTVSRSNLQRQILYTEDDIGKSKIEVATQKLKKLNKNVEIKGFFGRLSPENVLELFKDYDVIVDGTDNFETRYLMNDGAVLLRKPFFTGAVNNFFGQITTIFPFKTPCYRCIFPTPPPIQYINNPLSRAVIGTTPALIGTLLANNVIKYFLEIGDILEHNLLIYSGDANTFEKIKIERDRNCPVCGEKPKILEPLKSYKIE